MFRSTSFGLILLSFLQAASCVKDCVRELNYNAIAKYYSVPNGFLNEAVPVPGVADCVKLCYNNELCEAAFLHKSNAKNQLLCTLTNYSDTPCPSSVSAYKTTINLETEVTMLHCIVCRNSERENVVVQWNKLAQNVVVSQSLQPPESTRMFAIFHSAIHRGYVRISSQPAISDCPSRDEIVIAGIAHATIVDLFPVVRYDADGLLRSTFSNATCSDSSKNEVYHKALQTAMEVLSERAKDNCPCFVDYRWLEKTGAWRPPRAAPKPFPLLPCWGNVTLFGDVGNVETFLPEGPPRPDADMFKRSWEEMIVVGGKVSGKRTLYQTEAATLWHPPVFINQFNQLVADVLNQQVAVDDLKAYVKAFWLTSMASANSAVVIWRSKYIHNNWRPETALLVGMPDDTSLQLAPGWEPLLDTPVFPDYCSGHSGMGFSYTTVLASLFGDVQSFTVTDGTRTHYFRSLAVAGLENALSRVWGGVHWRFSCEDSIGVGKKMADEVLSRNRD